MTKNNHETFDVCSTLVTTIVTQDSYNILQQYWISINATESSSHNFRRNFITMKPETCHTDLRVRLSIRDIGGLQRVWDDEWVRNQWMFPASRLQGRLLDSWVMGFHIYWILLVQAIIFIFLHRAQSKPFYPHFLLSPSPLVIQVNQELCNLVSLVFSCLSSFLSSSSCPIPHLPVSLCLRLGIHQIPPMPPPTPSPVIWRWRW